MQHVDNLASTSVASTMVREMADGPESDDELLVGKPLGDYQLLALLGSGTSAHVYRGEKTRERNIVARAIKVIHKDQTRKLKGRFSEEERLLEDLRHENIVRFFKAGQSDGYLWMELELLEGKTLRVLLDEYRSRNERPPIKAMIEIMLQAARGVAFAHEYKNGVVHRDIKPDNIFVVENGNAKVLDFGIARALDDADRESVTMTGVGPPGSAPYMAPELWENKRPTRASDVYSLGITLMEAIAGVHPFEEPGQGKPSALACMKAHAEGKIKALRQLRPDVQLSLETVLVIATARNPKERYPSAREFVKALQDLLYEYEFENDRSSVTRFAKSVRQIYFAVAFLIVIGCLIAIILVATRYKSTSQAMITNSAPSAAAPIKSIDEPITYSSSSGTDRPITAPAVSAPPVPSANLSASPATSPPGCPSGSTAIGSGCATSLIKVQEYQECVDARICNPLGPIHAEDMIRTNELHSCSPPTDSQAPVACIDHEDAQKYCHFRMARLPYSADLPFEEISEQIGISGEWCNHSARAGAGLLRGIAPASKTWLLTGAPKYISNFEKSAGASYVGFRCILPPPL